MIKTRTRTIKTLAFTLLIILLTTTVFSMVGYPMEEETEDGAAEATAESVPIDSEFYFVDENNNEIITAQLAQDGSYTLNLAFHGQGVQHTRLYFPQEINYLDGEFLLTESITDVEDTEIEYHEPSNSITLRWLADEPTLQGFVANVQLAEDIAQPEVAEDAEENEQPAQDADDTALIVKGEHFENGEPTDEKLLELTVAEEPVAVANSATLMTSKTKWPVSERFRYQPPTGPNVKENFHIIGDGEEALENVNGGPNVVRMTPDEKMKQTQMWSKTKLNLTDGFETEFYLHAGLADSTKDDVHYYKTLRGYYYNIADGLAFVMHNDPDGFAAEGDSGAGLGVYGNSHNRNIPDGIKNHLAVEVDTHQNHEGGTEPDIGHIAVFENVKNTEDPKDYIHTAKNSRIIQNIYPLYRYSKKPWSTELKSVGEQMRYWNRFYIKWMPIEKPDGTLGGTLEIIFGDYYVDHNNINKGGSLSSRPSYLTMLYEVDDVDKVFNFNNADPNDREVVWGFTAATGDKSALQAAAFTKWPTPLTNPSKSGSLNGEDIHMKDFVKPGDVIDYTLKAEAYNNSDPNQTTTVEFIDELDEYLEYVHDPNDLPRLVKYNADGSVAFESEITPEISNNGKTLTFKTKQKLAVFKEQLHITFKATVLPVIWGDQKVKNEAEFHGDVPGVKDKTNAVITTVKGAFSCRIGKQGYYLLSDAIDAANSKPADEKVLIEMLVDYYDMTIPKEINKNVTIATADKNYGSNQGYPEYTGSNDRSEIKMAELSRQAVPFVINKNGTLAIKNIDFTGFGIDDKTEISKYPTYSFTTVKKDGTFEFAESGTLKNFATKDTLIQSEGTVLINGGTLESCNSAKDIIYSADKFVMESGSILTNRGGKGRLHPDKDPSIIHIAESSNAYIAGGSIEGNFATGNANISVHGDLHMSGGKIQGNYKSIGETGGIAVYGTMSVGNVDTDGNTIRNPDPIIIRGNQTFEGGKASKNVYLPKTSTENANAKNIVVKADLPAGSNIGVATDTTPNADDIGTPLTIVAVPDKNYTNINNMVKYFRHDQKLRNANALPIVHDPRAGKDHLILGEVNTPFSFTKVSDGSHNEPVKPLSGAEFTLYTCPKNHTHEQLVTDAVLQSGHCWQVHTLYGTNDKAIVQSDSRTGLVDFTGLIDGEYMLVENKAPRGYEKPYGQWQITVRNAKINPAERIDIQAVAVEDTHNAFTPLAFATENGKLQLPNQKKRMLPGSGFDGIYPYMLAGVVLLSIATLAFVVRLHNKKIAPQPNRNTNKNNRNKP